jgi:hypothetical protein
MFLYCCYGLTLASDIALPELPPAQQTDAIDVTICAGVSPDPVLCGAQLRAPCVRASGGVLHIAVPNIAQLWVAQGKIIVYDLPPGADLGQLRLFLLGSGLGAALMQRGFLVMHASALQVGTGAILCTGASGVGKSTLAAAMMQRGYPVLADDVSPISETGQVIPGLPRLKLWQSALDHLKLEATEGARLIPEHGKFHVPLGAAHAQKRLGIYGLYVLDLADVDSVSIRTLSGAEKFFHLHRNTYRLEFVRELELERQHFDQIAALARTVRVCLVRRPRSGFALDSLSDAIIDDCGSRV